MLYCPRCISRKIKKNGQTHYGKQNHKCKVCGRQFVLHSSHYIEEDKRSLIRKSLKERISLRGICRVFAVSLKWLLQFMLDTYEQTPEDLGAVIRVESGQNRIQITGIEIDEAWSYVQKKENKCWIWVAYHPASRQVIAFHIGGRAIDSAKALWKKIPPRLRKYCTFYTDDWKAYKSILPSHRHVISKNHTRHIESLFCTMRQRMSRLVRRNLAFSKKWDHHELAIKYFLWQLNLQRALHL